MPLPLGIILRAILSSPPGKKLIKEHGVKEAIRLSKKAVDKSLVHPRGSEAFLEIEKLAVTERAAVEGGKKIRPDYKKLWEKKDKATPKDAAQLDPLAKAKGDRPPGSVETFEQVDILGDVVKPKTYRKRGAGSNKARTDQDFKGGTKEQVVDPGKVASKRVQHQRYLEDELIAAKKQLEKETNKDVKDKLTGQIAELRREIRNAPNLPLSAFEDASTTIGVTRLGQQDAFRKAGLKAQKEQQNLIAANEAAAKQRVYDAVPQGRKSTPREWSGKITEQPKYPQIAGETPQGDIGFAHRPMFAVPVTKTPTRTLGKPTNRPQYAWEKDRVIPRDKKDNIFTGTDWEKQWKDPRYNVERTISAAEQGGLKAGQMGPPKLVSGGWRIPRGQSKTGMTYDEFIKLSAAEQKAIQRKIALEEKGSAGVRYNYGYGQKSQTGMTKAAFNKLNQDEKLAVMDRIKMRSTGVSRPKKETLPDDFIGPPNWKYEKGFSPKDTILSKTQIQTVGKIKRDQEKFVKDALKISEYEWKKLTPSERLLVKTRVLGKEPIGKKAFAKLSREERKNYIPYDEQKISGSAKDEIKQRLERKYREVKKGGLIKTKAKPRKKTRTSASKRGDGIAKKGLTKGRMV